MDVEILTMLLTDAEKAHAEYEAKTFGGARDQHWQAWYAEYIITRYKHMDRMEG